MVHFREFITEKRNPEDLKNIFIDLSKELETIHEEGFSFLNLNSNNILIDEDSLNATFNQRDIVSDEKLLNKEANLKALVKIGVGTFFLGERDYLDFSLIEDDFILQNEDFLKTHIPEELKDYFFDVIRGKSTDYYDKYILQEGNVKKAKGKRLNLATEYGKHFIEEEGFVSKSFLIILAIFVLSFVLICVLAEVL